MHSRFLKFFISRLLGTLVDTLVIWLLTRFFFSSYTETYIIAPIISFEVATLFNYIVSYLWIWHKNIEKKSFSDFSLRFLKYNLSVIVGFAVKMGFLLMFERLFGWDVIYCNIAALCISGIVNFILAEYVVFKKGTRIAVVEGYEMLNTNNHKKEENNSEKPND